MDKLTLFVLDDSLPKISKFVEKEIYEKKIDYNSLLYLLKVGKWDGELSLKRLLNLIVNSEHAKSGRIDIWGFTHPSICLDTIDEGLKSDIIIYDWEYGSEQNYASSNWLKEILKTTNSFVFVYSQVRNEIPPFLNKSEFDQYSERFQLFLKGDKKSSIFSSEEFILQYILARISKENRIKIQNKDILFEENGYLKNPSDILHLENVIGRSALEKILGDSIDKITNKNIENIIESVNVKVYLDENKKLLVTADSSILLKKITKSDELSSVDVLRKFGILKLQELLDIGVAKI
ncbi:MAG: hypothetical protein WDZ80_01730 [Candidatus Paceibacterota bacterium]